MHVEPKDRIGKSKELTYEILMRSAPDASLFFITVGNRLLHPGGWHKLTRNLGAIFYPINVYGDGVTEVIQEENFIRIRIPGFGNIFGLGYDWVRVESLAKTKSRAGGCELLEMKIRPCLDPRKKEMTHLHFPYHLADIPASSFLIERVGRVVKATYFRWNDTSEKEKVGFGSTLGLSEMQWTQLLQGFLKDETF